MSVEITKPRAGLFLISRTNEWGEKVKPCDSAFQIARVLVDERYVNDPRKIPANKGTCGDWYERGTNHRVENGHIKRDIGTGLFWAVEVTDVAAFRDAIGKDIIVSRDNEGYATLEIYE